MLNTSFTLVDSANPQTLLITGSVHGGKTRLARAYTASHVERGDTVIWIDNDVSPERSLKEWLDYFTTDYGNEKTARATLTSAKLFICIPTTEDIIEIVSRYIELHSDNNLTVVVNDIDRNKGATLASFAKEHNIHLIAIYSTAYSAKNTLGDIPALRGDDQLGSAFDCVVNIRSYDNTNNDQHTMRVIRIVRELKQESCTYTLEAKSGMIMDMTE